MKMRSVLLVAACLLAPQVVLAQSTVVAVNGPLASLAKDIGGDAVDVVYPVPAGTDPALWRPSVAQIGEIQGADLILLNGAGFAKWTAKTTLPRARTLVTSRAFEDALIETEAGVTHSHGGDGEHSHTGIAPLTWLDFSQAAQQAHAIAGRLARLSPDVEIAERAADLAAELAALHARAQGLGARLDGQAVLADHPGYEYFARAYGLELSALDWAPGYVPDGTALETLGETVDARGAAVFLFQTTPSPEAAAAVEALGMKSVVFESGSAEPDGFLQRMNSNLDALATAIEALE